ncbi:MAG: hypothetical protein ABMA02_14235 [Saprospiraceae bacterium]
MKKLRFIAQNLCCLLLCCTALRAQTPVLWATTELSGGIPVFRTKTPGSTTDLAWKTTGDQAFNFNNALFFDGSQNALELPLPMGDWQKMTVFVVFWPSDSLMEKSVWFLEQNSRTRQWLTTHRLSDWLSDRSAEVMNLLDTRKDAPLLSVYEQIKSPDSLPVASQRFVLGVPPPTPDVPVQPFRGKIAEVIVFDQVLAPEKRLEVETYLAFKYGLMLQPSESPCYVDSRGKTLRDSRKCGRYQCRLAAIGRDDCSGLLQKQSVSVYDPGLLRLAAGGFSATNTDDKTDLPDGSFWIWADDNQPLRLTDQPAGFASKLSFRPLARQWLMITKGAVQNTTLALQFDTRRTDWDWRGNEHWWLRIDRSGSGNFPIEHTDYIAAQPLDATGVAQFESVFLGERAVFSFATGPGLMAVFDLTAPMCEPVQGGTLRVKAVGGSAPYTLAVSGLDIFFQQKIQVESGQLVQIEGMVPGRYAISLRDAGGQVFTDSIWVQAADSPVASLQNEYQLQPGQTLQLDAAKGIADASGIRYRWAGPSGFESSAAVVSITRPGTYFLEMERSGCVSRQAIIVRQPSADPFRRVEVFPNPAPDGHFSLLLDLHESGPVDVQILGAAGRLLQAQTLRGSDRYLQPMHVPAASGALQVLVTTARGWRCLPVVVQR